MRRRRLILAFASGLGATLAALVAAVMPSVAAAAEPYGYVEVCKTFAPAAAGAPQYQGTFVYTISDGDSTRTVTLRALEGGPQECTQPIAVPAGTATVTEHTHPWFSVASITATQGDPGTVTPIDTAGQATVSVNPAPNPGDESLTTTVQYANDPVTGVVEVCKQADANSPSETGTYTFDVTSASPLIRTLDTATNAYDQPWSTTASATISAGGLGCSGPIVVPAGTVLTTEPGTTYVTGITATSNGSNELLDGTTSDPNPNLSDGSAYVDVAAGDTANQTIVTYTDALSTVKLCKEWSGDGTPTTTFPFTLTSTGPDGPTAVLGSVGLNARNCEIVGTVRTGTQVNITEGIVPGTKVASISVSPTANSQGASPIVTGSLSLPNRTVSIIAGAGETDVTYVDETADPGTLKICVAPTTNPAAGVVPFTVNGTQTIDVNLSSTAVQCTLDSSSFPFDGPVTIAGGTLPTTDAFTGTPSVVPTNVEVYEGGIPTDTNQPSLSASTASSATVLLSEGIVTEVTFTVDPPVTPTAPPVTVIQPVVGGGSVVTDTPVITPSAVVITPSVTPPVPTVTPPQPAVVTPVIAPAVNTSGNNHARVLATQTKIRTLDKQITHVNAQIKAVNRALNGRHSLSRAARRSDQRELTALRNSRTRLERQLANENKLLRQLRRI